MTILAAAVALACAVISAVGGAVVAIITRPRPQQQQTEWQDAVNEVTEQVGNEYRRIYEPQLAHANAELARKDRELQELNDRIAGGPAHD